MYKDTKEKRDEGFRKKKRASGSHCAICKTKLPFL